MIPSRNAELVTRNGATWIALLSMSMLIACDQKTITPVETAFNKGVYHQSAGNYDEAIAEYQQAVQDDPTDYRSLFNLGTAYEQAAAEAADAGRADEARMLRQRAEAAYERVLEHHPDNVRAAVNLAALRYERGQRDAAKARLREMTQRRPDLALPRNALAAWLMREGDHAAALKLLETAASVEPANLTTNYLLGQTRWKLGDINGARDAFAKALLRQPDDIATLMSAGRLEHEQGDLAAARNYFQSVLYIDPDHQPAHDHIAVVLEKLGDLEGAVGHTWRARDLAEDADRRARHQRKLDELYKRLLEEKKSAK